MVYFLIILSLIIIIGEQNFIYEKILNLENTTDFVVLVIYSIIIISSMIIMYKILTYSRVTNKKYKSVHVHGAFGRGKTYKVMNSSFDELLHEKVVNSTLLKNRVKNYNRLESEYVTEESSNDVLYFSALGKTQGELLLEINYEIAYGINKFFIMLLRNFNLQKINVKYLFNNLEKNKSNKRIKILIIDDLERMSDMQHDMEINRMIRLIIQLQKNYNTIIITASDTKKNPIIKPIYGTSYSEDEDQSNIFKEVNFVIDDFGSDNFKIKFAKINFDSLIHISDDKNTIEEIRDKYLNAIESIIIKCARDQNVLSEIKDKYEKALEIELNSEITGDIRAIKLCYKSILQALNMLSNHELLCIINYNFSDTLKYFFKQSNLKYNESLFDGHMDVIEYNSFQEIVYDAVTQEMWSTRSSSMAEEIRNNTDMSIFESGN